MRFNFTFLLFFIVFLCSAPGFAQTTSSSISGIARDDSNAALSGAIVEAVHVPSGTKYGTSTRDDGSFNIQNMRVGGPYKVTVSYGGVIVSSYDNVFLSLGETYELDVKLAGGKELAGVTVSGTRDDILNNARTGASTIITETEIATLPSIGRSATDYTNLTPQVAFGTSFEGQDGRYNNAQINGANFNNSFGLSSALFPGSGQPFSMDAIQQIQVAISPYDVLQSNFTGANINMVTRSGTNDLTGSVYTYWRNETYNGKYVGADTLPKQTKSTNNVYGVRVGGAIDQKQIVFLC